MGLNVVERVSIHLYLGIDALVHLALASHRLLEESLNMYFCYIIYKMFFTNLSKYPANPENLF